MPCSPNDNSLNPPNLGPPPGIPPAFAPPQLSDSRFELPEGIPEDIIQLVNDILALLPGGLIRPNLDHLGKEVLDAIASLLNQIAPYLVLYRFFQSLLNIILCILDVICSLLNPFKVFSAIRKLFKRCLPDFLSLFPWLALIAMIIALILLLLALIEYLIRKILEYIEEIIRNLQILAEAAQLESENSVLAAVNKIAYLLCTIEQLFAILIAFQAILAIIEALMQLGGRTVCARTNNTGDDSECCTEDVCPDFIVEQPNGFFGESGLMIYHRQLNNDTSNLGVTLELPPIREERWQFLDTNVSQQFAFRDIITPIDDNIFWPEGISFESNSSLKKTPYICDMTVRVNPALFGHTDTGGERPFFIRDAIVVKKPIIGVTEADGTINTDPNQGFDTGTLFLEGGLVFEEDQTTAYLINGTQATLNTFITQQSLDVTPPVQFEDGYQFTNISYNLRINHEALFGYALITAGCEPNIAQEAQILNETQLGNIAPVIDRIGALPNVTSALACLNQSLATYRADVSIESSAIFQASVESCLGALRDEALDTYDRAVCEATDRFASTVSVNPSIQFVGESIIATVVLKDIGGTTISFRVPSESEAFIASKISGEVTLGEISGFTFDGYESFTAEITSEEAGEGQLTISFDGQVFGNILNRDNDDVPTEIEDNIISYQFVGTLDTGSDDLEKRRRGKADVASTGGS